MLLAFAKNSVPMGRGFERFVAWAIYWRFSDRHLAAVVETNSPDEFGGSRRRPRVVLGIGGMVLIQRVVE
jgi:hypothetical protein